MSRVDVTPLVAPVIRTDRGCVELPLLELFRKFLRGSTIQTSVGPGRVVLDPPGFDGALGIRQAHKPALVQAFVPQLAVEALGVSVFDRLAALTRYVAGVVQLTKSKIARIRAALAA